MGATVVIRIPLGLTSAFLIKGEKTILVDTGVPSTIRRIRHAMDANGVKASDVSLIVLTHGHADHAGGANAAREITGAKIAMHKDCAERLSRGLLPDARPRTGMSCLLEKLFGRMMKVAPVQPDIVIGDEFDLTPFGVEGKAVSTPGHTTGCVSILLKDGQAVVGDLLMGKARGTKAGLPMFLWDLIALKKSLYRVINAKPRIIHNAHGPSCTLDACCRLVDSIH